MLSSGGFSLNVDRGLGEPARADTPVVPGYDLDRPIPACSTDTVTTHRRAADLPARRHPEVTVNPEVRYLAVAAPLPAVRIDLARQLLESGDTGIDRIARRAGLGTPANFRARFRKATGTSPTAYRRTFGPA